MSFEEWYEDFHKEWIAEICKSTERLREYRHEFRKATSRANQAIQRLRDRE